MKIGSGTRPVVSSRTAVGLQTSQALNMFQPLSYRWRSDSRPPTKGLSPRQQKNKDELDQKTTRKIHFSKLYTYNRWWSHILLLPLWSVVVIGELYLLVAFILFDLVSQSRTTMAVFTLAAGILKARVTFRFIALLWQNWPEFWVKNSITWY